MFQAKHYVTIGGREYAPGQVIAAGLDAAKKAWLLSKGAIEAIDEAPEMPDMPDVPVEDAEEETDAPTIDVMDGIIAPEPEAPRKRGRKGGNGK